MSETQNDDGLLAEEAICPYCRSTTGQAKAGTSEGSQRYKCGHCKRRYIVDRRQRGYGQEARQRALALHSGGLGIREIGRTLGVTAQTVSNWLRRPMNGEEIPSPRSALSILDQVATGKPLEEERTDPPVGEKRRATISDVAQEAGVSTTTVSNFLNKKGYMGEETRRRIETAIETLHFTPNALVRAIQKRRTHIIGVLVFGIYDLDENPSRSLAHPLLAGINRAADQAGYNVLLYTGYPHRFTENQHLEFLDGHTDGLLWVVPPLEDPALERVVQAGLPTVTVLTRHVPPGAGWVNTDNFQAMHDLIAHLVNLGHRRIAYFGPVTTSDFLDRQEGYRQALAAYGIKWDPALEVCPEDEPWSLPRYSRELDTWLSLEDPPTAILGANDGLAEDMVRLLEARGRRVPEDVAVTGFDDVPEARFMAGGLTTAHQPFREIGQIAAERLIARINGAPIEECQVSVPAPIVIRNSTLRER